MRKLWLALIVLSVFASVTAFAASANYLGNYGGGIIAEFEQLNPVNPAGIQFTNNFAQLELFNQNAGTAVGVVDPNGSPNVGFTFPLVASLKFNDLLGFRLGLFEPNESVMINNIRGVLFNTRMGGNPGVTLNNVFTPFAISWGMKMANMGIGVKYELNNANQGKFNNDNFIFAYSRHKIEPGVVLNIGNMKIDVIADINLVMMNWSVANTNTTGAFVTNSIAPKSPFETLAIKGQIQLPLFSKLIVAGRVEAGMGSYGFDEKYNANGGTQTNDVQASAYMMQFMLGLKYAPVAFFDAYVDIGTKLFGHNVLLNYLGTTTSTNTNSLNQYTFPSIRVGVAFKPSIFTISLGLQQDIINSSSPITSGSTANISTGAELDTQAAVYTANQGNTVLTMLRAASLGVSVNLNPVILEALVDISATSFLGNELVNPLDVLDRIFNNAPDIGIMFTGVRCSVLF